MSSVRQNKDLNSASKSIKDLYEDKLYYKIRKPLWKNWIETSGPISHPPKSVHVLFSNDSRTKTNGDNANKVMTVEKVQEFRCLDCSGINCVRLMEKTEDALDALRGCTQVCKKSILETFPTLKTNKSNASGITNNGLVRSVAASATSCNIPPSAQNNNNHCSTNPLTLNRQAFLDPDQLIYSRHRSLIAAGKMKQQIGKKPVRVHLLNGDSILLVFDPKVLVKEVFEQICSLHSIKEGHFFGLSAIVDNEHRFMDLKLKLSKYAPKEWCKEPKRRASDLSVQPSSVFTIQFQVQYYVEHPKLISNHQSRHHYYLQLKRNVLQSKVPAQDELIFTLAATALHLDKGTFDQAIHSGHYFDPHDYVPGWFLKKWGESYLWSHLPTLHRELTSMSTFAALSDYIKQASSIDDVPVHYHRLFKNKGESRPTVIMGIFNRGVRIHHVTSQGLEGPHLLDFEFPWNKVGRLFFAGKRFEIYPEDQPSSRKLIYFTGSRSRSKYLLRLLRDTHSLYMSLSPFVDHMREVDGKTDRRKFRESYISGMNLEERIKDGVDERLVGSIYKTQSLGKVTETNIDQIAAGRLITSKSSMSRGSSHTSGVESDGKIRVEDAPEVGDDDAFLDDFDPIELDGPSSGGSTDSKRQHSMAPLQGNITTNTSAEATDSKEFASSKTGGAMDNATSSHQVPQEGGKEPLDFKREDPVLSANKIFLDTQTLPFKTATLQKSSCKKTVSVASAAAASSTDVISVGDLPRLNRIASEELLASILHDSKLDPVNPEKTNPVSNCVRTCPKKNKVSSGNSNSTRSSKVKVHGSSKEKGSSGRIVSEVRKPCGDDAGRRRKHSKERGHRRHMSAHDADFAQKERLSTKHFGEPLSQKQSFEDLTSLAPLDRSEKSGDIPGVLTAYPFDHFQYQKKLDPVACPVPSASHLCNPVTAARSDKSVNSAPVSHSKTNGTKHHKAKQIVYQSSDATGFTSTTRRTSNGYAVGAAGFTPQKPALFMGDCHLTSGSDSSPRCSHVVTDINMSKSCNRSYCKLGSENHTPVFVESHHEVIV